MFPDLRMMSAAPRPRPRDPVPPPPPFQETEQCSFNNVSHCCSGAFNDSIAAAADHHFAIAGGIFKSIYFFDPNRHLIQLTVE
jgi:hypothetical protein